MTRSSNAVAAVRSATAAMGTRFEIVVASTDGYSTHPIVEEALREIEDLHRRLTRFSADSLISHINRTAPFRPVRLDAGTFALLAAAQAVCRQSGGAFDVAVGSGSMILDESTCTVALSSPAVKLDLGGIAKGYALDRAAALLRENGVTAALLHGGTSSVVAIGSPPDAAAWRVALAHGHRFPFIDLCDAALGVSRPHAQINAEHTHITDARNGADIAAKRFAVVVGPSACLADAWSTALAVLGERPPGLSRDWTTFIELEHE